MKRKIGIDARFFGPRDKGLGRYNENLVRNLEKIDKENQYFIFLRKERLEDYQPANQNFKKILVRWPFLMLLKKYNLDLMHFTFYKVPIFYKNKFILTVHDLTWQRFPIFNPLKKLIYKIGFNLAVQRAEKIIAVSNYTKGDILRHHRVNPNKIKVIYEGVAGYKEVRPPQINVNIRRSNLQKYILYVGNDYPHKNLKRLILAFKKLVKEHNLNYQLVLVTKFVSEEELNDLYRNASLYVFPSLSEGFGLPAVEAMARGVPIVSSNATCLPEILGEAAVYFNPLDVDDISEKIFKTLSDDRAKKNLIQRGFDQIKKYNWQEMAKKTLEIYQNTPQ